MKPGDEITCKYCKKHGFLIKKTVMDGWTKKGEVLACSSCGKTIEKINQPDNKNKETAIGNEDKLDKLASFLGTEKEEKKTIEEGEKKFCRDCKNYIAHPFVNRCGLKDIEVNPMDDCENFEKKDL